MGEIRLQAAFLLAAPRALPEIRFFRRNVLAVRIEGRAMRAGIRGQSDIYGIVRGGMHIELELKAATAPKRLPPDQEAWAAFCRGWGIPHLVLRARSEESDDETVERWCLEIVRAVGG